ncbi:MAG: hypothetical protein IT452_23070 [Planctomycetia bacterium]|nr:hypothetical protein [Planctomycetia bacterium]
MNQALAAACAAEFGAAVGSCTGGLQILRVEITSRKGRGAGGQVRPALRPKKMSGAP